MSIKYKNDKGLNEKKASQAAMNTGGKVLREEFRDEYFEIDDQDSIEEKSGEQGQTSGKSFDKHRQKR